ncbi:MAG: J domain-containing protein [Thermoplasmatota archaeon]
MRTAALSALFISLMFLVLMFSVQETGAASDDPVYIELKISFNDQSSGHIHFFMGSGVEREMNGTDFIPSSTDPYVNDNMDRLLRALQMGGSGSPQITRSILDSSGTLNISKTRISSMAERNYFGLSLDTDFRYPANGISGEFEYLDFIYEVDKMFRKPSGGLDEITSALAKERELRRIRIRVEIELEDGMSATTSTTVSEHRRSITEEEISESTNAQEFIRSSNSLKVFDHPLLSPTFIFLDLVLFLFLGYGILAIVWWRERFKGVALILPVLTAVFPVFLVLVFLNPGWSIYSLAGGTVWIMGGIFLLMVGACNLFNPKFRYRDFEQEREEQPPIKLPEVIYINKRVFVDRPVRISEEEVMDPYKVLDVGRRSSWEDIDKAYKSKVREYHPDKFVNSPERIHKAAREETERLNTAYERLKRKHGM